MNTRIEVETCVQIRIHLRIRITGLLAEIQRGHSKPIVPFGPRMLYADSCTHTPTGVIQNLYTRSAARYRLCGPFVFFLSFLFFSISLFSLFFCFYNIYKFTSRKSHATINRNERRPFILPFFPLNYYSS